MMSFCSSDYARYPGAARQKWNVDAGSARSQSPAGGRQWQPGLSMAGQGGQGHCRDSEPCSGSGVGHSHPVHPPTAPCPTLPFYPHGPLSTRVAPPPCCRQQRRS